MGGWVNPYGQPDRKISVFFDDFPYLIDNWKDGQTDRLISQCMQVIVVTYERETGGFLAPSITILAMEGWKGNTTVEKCLKRVSKLN